MLIWYTSLAIVKAMECKVGRSGKNRWGGEVCSAAPGGGDRARSVSAYPGGGREEEEVI